MALLTANSPVKIGGLTISNPLAINNPYAGGGSPTTTTSTSTAPKTATASAPAPTPTATQTNNYVPNPGPTAADIAAAQAAQLAAQQVAQFDQSIGNTQSAINRLGDQEASGDTTIDASWQNALNQLLLSKNQGQTDYNANKLQTGKDFISAKNTIGTNAGAALNGLQRLLGARGAGGSLAATLSAPGAVAREATIQRSGATDTYGQNNQTLDTNWNRYLTGYNNEVSSANSQRDQGRQSLHNNIETNRADLLQTLAGLFGQRATAAGGNPVNAAQPYLDQANRILDQTSRYNVAPISVTTQDYTAPSLSSYTTNSNATPTVNGQTQGNDYTSPYLAALLGKKQLVGA